MAIFIIGGVAYQLFVSSTVLFWCPNLVLSRMHFTRGDELLPHNGPYKESPRERVTLLGLQVYVRVGISPPEVYKRVGKFVISIVKGQKGLTVEKKFRSCVFLSYTYFIERSIVGSQRLMWNFKYKYT